MKIRQNCETSMILVDKLLEFKEPEIIKDITRMDSQSLTMSLMSRSTARASVEIPNQPSYSAAMQSSIAWQVCIMKSKMWCVFKPLCQVLVSLTKGSNFDHGGCFISGFSTSDSLSSQSNQILLRIQIQNLPPNSSKKCQQTIVTVVLCISCILFHVLVV